MGYSDPPNNGRWMTPPGFSDTQVHIQKQIQYHAICTSEICWQFTQTVLLVSLTQQEKIYNNNVKNKMINMSSNNY